MFSKRNLSILITAVLICACVVGVIFTGAKAGGTEFIWYVDGKGESDNCYATIDTAMAAAKAKTDWAEGDTLTIKLSQSTTTTFNTTTGATDTTGRNIFNVMTVFRADNTKLPITIDGTSAKYAITLANTPSWAPVSGQKSFAASNDYTFKNLDLSSWGNSTHTFYAGSGMVTFDNVDFGTTQTMIMTSGTSGWVQFRKWTPEQFAANAGEDGLMETGFTFLNTDYGKNNGTLASRNADTGIDGSGSATEGGLTIKNTMLRTKITIGEGSTVAHVNHHAVNSIKTLAYAPAESVIEVDGGTVTNVYSVRGSHTGVGNKLVFNMKSGSVNLLRMGPNGADGKFTGDLELNWTGGTVTELRAAYLGTVDGDVTFNAKDVEITWGECTIVGSTVTGTLYNNIEDCTLTGQVYMGAKAQNVVNTLSGTINTDDYWAYLGTNSQTIAGNLTNNISCTWNYTGTGSEKHLFCGSFTGAVSGKITNNFTSAANITTPIYGGGRQANIGSIENTVNGGTFASNFFGGNRESGNIGSVKTTINSGTFGSNSYLADRGATSVTSATVEVNGGIFDGNIYLGSNFGNIGTLTSTVTGGTFKYNLFGTSLSGTVTTRSFTIKPDGNKLSLLSRVEGCTEFIGNDGTVSLGSGSTITAETASGSVTFHQIKGWFFGTYFTAASGSIEIKHTKASGASGSAKVEGNTLSGATDVLYGTSFYFTDKVQLVFYFMKNSIDSADSFDFTVTTSGGRTIKSASLTELKANPTADGKYYTLITSPLKASEMAHSITYEGNCVETSNLNLLDLASRGATIAQESKDTELEALYKSYANYAVSVRNYAAAKEGLEANTLPYEATEAVQPVLTGDAAIGAGPLKLIASPSISFSGRSLVLDEGIRIRYYGTATSSTAANSLTLYVNNQKVDNAFTYVSGASLPLRMDIPVSVTEGQTLLRITVKDADGKAHFDYVERLDCLAYDLTLVDQVELGSEALNYFLSAVNYQKASKTDKVLSQTLPEGFTVGYGSDDATPYGVAATLNDKNLGVDTSEPIYVTCVAVSDGNPDNTVLYFSIPARKVPDRFVNEAIVLLLETTNVKEENIFFNATHSHSAPNITAGYGAPGIECWYKDYLYPSVILSAQEALLDLSPATAYVGSADADPGTASIRRFFDAEGNFKSIQGRTLNPIKDTSKAGQYESEIDRAVRTIEFRRNGKAPILMLNWQCHAASAVEYLHVDPAAAKVSAYDVDDSYISADFVYYIQADLEAAGYLPAFFNGGSGDINCANNLNTSNVNALKAKWNTTQIHYAVGKDVAITAQNAAKAGVQVNTGSTISSATVQEEVTVRKDPAARVDAARLCSASFNDVQELNRIYNMYGFDSGLEITHMLKRNDTLGETDEVPLSAVTFGDLAFAFAPFELFHETATQVRDGAPDSYKMTFVCGYTNGDDGYMPTTKAFKNEGYEHYACFYVDGTAEQCAQKMIQLIKELTK